MVKTLKERIKELRKDLKLTQQKFSEKLGLKRQTIAAYEIGNIEPSDSTLLLICREFNVNEHWLRTGEGDMYIEKERIQAILDFVNNLQKKPDSFQTRFLESMIKLDEKDWEDIERLFDKLSSNNETETKKLLNNKDSDISATLSSSKEMTVKEAEASYIKSLLNTAKKTTPSALSSIKEGEKVAN